MEGACQPPRRIGRGICRPDRLDGSHDGGTHEHSHEFVQNAKTICEKAPHTVPGVTHAAAQIAALAEPPNVHRAVSRLELHWRRIVSNPSRSERKQVRLSAHLLGVSACGSVTP